LNIRVAKLAAERPWPKPDGQTKLPGTPSGPGLTTLPNRDLASLKIGDLPKCSAYST
jgi:hypothetical protein